MVGGSLSVGGSVLVEESDILFVGKGNVLWRIKIYSFPHNNIIGCWRWVTDLVVVRSTKIKDEVFAYDKTHT